VGGRVLDELRRVIDELEVVRCEECRLPLLDTDHRRWRADWIDDGPEDKLIFYCPECAKREFGGD
jgi:RNase P subunit RPR2